VHGVSYVDERLMMYDDDTDRPYYFVTDRMHNVRVIVDRAGAIRERYAYDPYGRPLIRELCGRGDMNDDTRMTTTPDDARFAAAKAGSIWDPRADMDDDGDVDGADETAYHNKKPTWSSVMSAPTVSQAFSDFDNPYMFQGVPHFAIDTAANATSEQLNLALNHHRANIANAPTGQRIARHTPSYNQFSSVPAFPNDLVQTRKGTQIRDERLIDLTKPSLSRLFVTALRQRLTHDYLRNSRSRYILSDSNPLSHVDSLRDTSDDCPSGYEEPTSLQTIEEVDVGEPGGCSDARGLLSSTLVADCFHVTVIQSLAITSGCAGDCGIPFNVDPLDPGSPIPARLRSAPCTIVHGGLGCLDSSDGPPWVTFCQFVDSCECPDLVTEAVASLDSIPLGDGPAP
jgi:hypothetical protein